MIIDRTHFRWGIGTAVASVGVALVYFDDATPGALQALHLSFPLPRWIGPIPPVREEFGSTPLGLIYGTAALLIFIFAALLGWRRSRSSWPLGRIQLWLKAHIWLTLFTVPLVVFHSGFHGGGPMTQFLLWLYAFVMLSGIWGLFMQHIVPKLMREYLPEEVIFEQIPFIRERIIADATTIRQELTTQANDSVPVVETTGGATVATLTTVDIAALNFAITSIDLDLLPYLKSTNTRGFLLRDAPTSDDRFRLLRLRVPEVIHPSVNRLEQLCDQKRRLDFQSRLHYWLHGWLLVHAPSSLLLVVLTIVHAIVATFMYA